MPGIMHRHGNRATVNAARRKVHVDEEATAVQPFAPLAAGGRARGFGFAPIAPETFDDGCARATTSPGITAALKEMDDVLHIQVSPVRRALQRQSTAENELM